MLLVNRHLFAVVYILQSGQVQQVHISPSYFMLAFSINDNDFRHTYTPLAKTYSKAGMISYKIH